MEVTKYVRSLKIFTHTMQGGEVSSAAIADSAFRAFERKAEMTIEDDGRRVFVPYHAIDHVETSVEQETEEVDDDTCQIDCDIMSDPVLNVPTEAVVAIVGEEFDPLEGVTALDSLKHRLNVSVEVDMTLTDENSTPITDENSENLIAG